MPLPDDPLTGILELILDQWRNQIARLHALEGKLTKYARELEQLVKKLIDEGTEQTFQLRDQIELASRTLRSVAGTQREVAERFLMPDALLKTIDFFYPQLQVPEMKRKIREKLQREREEGDALRTWLGETQSETGGVSLGKRSESLEDFAGGGRV